MSKTDPGSKKSSFLQEVGSEVKGELRTWMIWAKYGALFGALTGAAGGGLFGWSAIGVKGLAYGLGIGGALGGIVCGIGAAILYIAGSTVTG